MANQAIKNSQALAFPTRDLPFVDETRRIIQSWFQVLITLYNRTGGATGNGIFESTPAPLATTVNVAHGLPMQPQQWKAIIQCVTPDLGYAVGDEVDVTKHDDGTNGCSTGVSTTNIFWAASSTALTIENKGTGARGAITPAKWNLILRAGVLL